MTPTEPVSTGSKIKALARSNPLFIVATILLGGLLHGGLHVVETVDFSTAIAPTTPHVKTEVERIAEMVGVDIYKEAQISYNQIVANLEKNVKLGRVDDSSYSGNNCHYLRPNEEVLHDQMVLGLLSKNGFRAKNLILDGKPTRCYFEIDMGPFKTAKKL